MSRILRRRPSPAMVVAFVALCVALAGTATALPGRARVKKDDIARAAVRAQHIYQNAVRSKHIKARNVTRSKIAKRSINSELVGKDAITGENIVESSLTTVPAASNSAKVNNRSVEKLAFVAPAGTPGTTVLNLNGLVITAACNAGPALSVIAVTTVSGANIHSGGTWSAGGADQPYYIENDTFDVGNSFDPLDTGLTSATNLRGSLTYVRQDGEVVTADFLAERDPGGNRCVFAGSAIG
jgi:hypothetical protein